MISILSWGDTIFTTGTSDFRYRLTYEKATIDCNMSTAKISLKITVHKLSTENDTLKKQNKYDQCRPRLLLA